MIILKTLEALFAGALGSFRGGDELPTGSTLVTRFSWAVLMGLLAFVNGYTFAATGALIVSLWLTMWFISHVPFQNLLTWKEYFGMFGVGLARGILVALSLNGFMPGAFWLFPAYGAVLVSSYTIGKYSPVNFPPLFSRGTPTAEYLTCVFLFLTCLAIKAFG